MNAVYLPFVTAAAANAFLNFGFGVRILVSPRGKADYSRSLAPAAAIGLSGLIVWPLFNVVLAPLALGYLESILLVPFAVLVSTTAERLVGFASKDGKSHDCGLSAVSAYDGLTYAASFFVLRLSAGFLDAFWFSLGAVAGYLVCEVALRAIRERSDIEPVPRFLRGTPLMLIAAALMAVLSSFLAAAAYSALGQGL